jgi:hypothetical protein
MRGTPSKQTFSAFDISGELSGVRAKIPLIFAFVIKGLRRGKVRFSELTHHPS